MPTWLSDPWLTDWLHLLVRWFHLVVGAGWIGASFYFNWLNNNVRPVADPTGRLAGGLWAVHGGAFYEVKKYKGAPETLPETLHWFKWEAYLTWLSGVTLMLLVYWAQAGVMMLPAGSPLSPAQGAAVGAGALALGWVVYDALCRSPLAQRPTLLAAVGFALLCCAALGLTGVFSPRAAWMHLGAMMGTMMALNVYFVIIPGQRAMVDAMVEGRDPPVERGRAGALRSLHNNYFTLPVLFVMVSNHFPFAYSSPLPWVVLVLIGLIGASVRHAINLHEQGHENRWIVPAASVAMLSLAFVVHGPRPPLDPAAAVPTDAQIETLIAARCTPCHAPQPTWPGITAPGKDVLLRTADEVRANRDRVHAQAIASQAMPLGNLTQITDAEREALARWLDAQAGATP